MTVMLRLIMFIVLGFGYQQDTLVYAYIVDHIYTHTGLTCVKLDLCWTIQIRTAV